jgi:tetratricopeptide (TPR) repeat protein
MAARLGLQQILEFARMRLALVVAPSDPGLGDAAARRESLAWLRGQLARHGFHVVIVGGGHDPLADIQGAVANVSEEDTVLLHVSGRLSGRDCLQFGKAGAIPLYALCDALAAKAPAYASFVLELMHEERAGDAALGSQCMAVAVRSLRARERGYSVLAAVRPVSASLDRVAFTRVALPPASDDAGISSPDVLLSMMYERAAAAPENDGVAQSFTFVRGAIEAPETQRDLGAFDAQRQSTERSIHSLIAEATEACDWHRAAELRLERLRTLKSPGQRVRELVAIARILQAELGDADGALHALEEARAIEPGRVGVLQALRRGYEVLGRWGNAFEVIGALATLAASPAERAALRVAQARISAEQLDDAEGAVSWLEVALEDDPTHAEARAELTRLRPPSGELRPSSEPPASRELRPSSEPPASRELRPSSEPPASRELRPSSEPPQSHEPPPSREAPPSSEAPPSNESEVDTLERLVDKMIAQGADHAALAELEGIAAREPTRASIYAKAFALHRRVGKTDAAFLAALALEELDATDVDEQVLLGQFRSVGPVRARASLDASAWDELRAPGWDDVLAALFSAVERAAIAARLEELHDARELVEPDPAARLSETSTASIGRSFQWAARMLGTRCPDLYVLGEVAGGISALQAQEPSTALGPAVLSGPTVKELAYLVGRHLTYYRPEYHALVYYPTREELTRLLFAAVQVSMPKGASGHDDPSVAALRARIARHSSAEDRNALDHAVRRLDARGGRASIGSWMRGVELTAARAGLLLCGDLGVAATLARFEPDPLASVTIDVQRGNLISFCASRAHASLRARFVTTAPESVRPGPPSSGVQAAELSS